MTRRINVLSLINKLPAGRYGGDEMRVLYASKYLDTRRFRHSVVLAYSPDTAARKDAGSLYNQYLDAGVVMSAAGPRDHHRRERTRHLALLVVIASLPFRFFRLLWLIRKRKTDLLDIHLGGTAGVLGSLASIMNRLPFVLTIYHPPTGTWPRIRRMVGRVYARRASLVITDSMIRKREISEWLGSPSPRVVVVPSAVEPGARRSVVEVREHFSLDSGFRGRIVGQIGRLIPFKGQMILLEAAARVVKEFPDVIFLIVGFGTPRDHGFKTKLENRARELGISHRVRVSGYPGYIGDVWQLIDIHIHASLFDSLPISILEGMFWGRPAVVTSTGGTRDLVKDGETGFVVEPEDVSGLSNALSALLRDPEMCMRMGVAAKERFNSIYDPRTLTKKLEALFLDVASSQAGRTAEQVQAMNWDSVH